MWEFSTLQFVTARGLSQGQPPLGLRATEAELKQRKKSQTAAIALWWNETSVTVKCPFCHKMHHHGVTHFAINEKSGRPVQDVSGRYTYEGPSPLRCESRSARCNHDVRVEICYTILFPFEDDVRVNGLSFEIEQLSDSEERQYERYRTVGLDVPQSRHCTVSESEEEKETRLRLQELTVRDGEFNVKTDISRPESPERDEIVDSASDLIIVSAITGNTRKMEGLLSKSRDAQALLKARDDNGTSLLSLAVCNGHQGAVSYLLERGVDVNVVDAQGRTPLMEAALWVHPVVVNMLLNAGSSPTMRDKAEMTAGDFAEESEANDEERHKRHIKYSENPFVAKRHRRLIKGLLGQSFSHNHPKSIQLDDLTDAYFYKSRETSTISLVIPRTGIHIRWQNKTAAFLNRGSPFPAVSVLSGRSGPDDQEFLEPGDGFERLNCQYWMTEAMRVAQNFGFEFESHRCDEPGVPGSFYAGHAESMLMCFFIKKNYIFRNYELGQTVEDDFLQLFMLQKREQQAQIVVSKSPCPSCLALREHVQSTLKIYFDLKEVEVRE